MDRRQAKTRKAIYTAFGRLLRHGRYEHITVQEIIDEANVGRSTFYAHFETKDHLIKAMCEEIFDHVFEGHPCEYSEKESTVCSDSSDPCALFKKMSFPTDDFFPPSSSCCN